MATVSLLYGPPEVRDQLDRKVLFVVELVDPMTQSRLWQRFDVAAEGLRHAPIVNRSGRFVWLMEGNAWPTKITVKSNDPRFASTERQAPPPPPDLEHVADKARLLRIELQPTRVYAFSEGVTALRGALTQSLQTNAPPIPNADVSLAWHDKQGGWHAQPPIKTDARGQFAVFVKLPASPTADVAKGLLRIRLQLVNGNVGKTTANFAFLSGPTDPLDRVPEGLLLYRDVLLGWAEL